MVLNNTTEAIDIETTEAIDIESIKARVLIDTAINEIIVKAGRVVELLITDADELLINGVIDTTPEAVEYALTENAEIIDLKE